MRLIGRRLALYALTFWVAITVNFLLPHFMPGNPIQTMIGKIQGQVTPQEIKAITTRPSAGDLNQALLSQYFTYLGQLAHGNLGFSFTKSAKCLDSREARAVDDRSDRRGDRHQFLDRHGLGCAARLDAGIATGLAHPHRDVLSGDAVLFPRDCDAPVLRQQPPLVPASTMPTIIATLHPGWTWGFVASALRYANSR